MRAECLSLLCVLLLGQGAAHADVAPLERASLLDGLAIVAGERTPHVHAVVVLRSDVELRARLGLLVAGSEYAARAELPADLLRATLMELLGEALIAVEAERLNMPAPQGVLLSEERQRLLTSAGGAAELNAFLETVNASHAELELVVQRRAVVRAFLEANLEGMVEVSEGELEQLFRSADHPFADRPWSDVRPMFRAWVLQRRLEEAVARWIESLKQRIPYRLLMAR